MKESSSTSGVSHLSRFGALYSMYMSTNAGRLPGSEKELRAYFATLEPPRKARLAAPDGADLFDSARDGQPLVVAYRGSSLRLRDPSGTKVAAYEAEGADGWREMVNVHGSVERVEESVFQQLLEARDRFAGGR